MQTEYLTMELELEYGDDTYAVIADFEVEVEVDKFSVAGKPMVDVKVRRGSIHVTDVSFVCYPNANITAGDYDSLRELARLELYNNPGRIEKILLDKLV